MLCTTRGNRGFTLVELMVSLTIFLIASMGLLPLLLNNLQVNRNNTLHGQARRLAADTMTRLQLTDAEQLTAASALPMLVGPIEVLQRVEPDQPASGLSRLTVTTRWEAAGRQHRYQLQSIRTTP